MFLCKIKVLDTMSLAKKALIFILSWFFVLLFTTFILFQATSVTILDSSFIISSLEKNQAYDKLYDAMSVNVPESAKAENKVLFKNNFNSLIKNAVSAISDPSTDYSIYEQYFGNNSSEFKQLIPVLKEASFLYANRIILLIVCAILLIILILLESILMNKLKVIVKLFFKSSITLFLYAGIMFVLTSIIFPQLLPKNNPLISILLTAISEILNSFTNQLLFYGVICLLFTLLLYLVIYLLGKKENPINKQLVSN